MGLERTNLIVEIQGTGSHTQQSYPLVGTTISKATVSGSGWQGGSLKIKGEPTVPHLWRPEGYAFAPDAMVSP